VKIVCLVKQIPRPDAIEFDQETKQLRREGVPLELNAFDAYAVAEAARLRDQHGGEVIAMTMGPPQAEEALRECIRLGADRGVHLSDRAFAVADTLGTSRTLAMAIAKEGGCDLVLCGRKTLDSETWQVPPEVAAFLGRPHAISATELALRDGRLRVRRDTDEGDETVELPLPAVVSVARTERTSWDARREGRIDVWTATDLVDDLREHDKRFGQTGSPTRVLAVRDVTPQRARELAASPEDAAERVAELLDERPKPVSPWEKPERLGEVPGKSYDSWSFVETIDRRPTRASLELVAKGRELAGKLGGANVALVLGHGVDGAVRELGRFGAERVVAADDERFAEYHPEVWAGALRTILAERRPHVVLFPSTANGRDLGPRVAGELRLGMTGDCVGLGIDRAGRLIQTKPAYGGNIVSVIMGATTPQLATVRARMFEPLDARDETAEIERVAIGEGSGGTATRIVARKPAPARDLDEADVVVCLGSELEPGDIRAARALAEERGAAVGGTRTVCERGDLPRNRQLGLFGRAVAPRLLVTVGVPGDFEELTGFVKAGVIAAVNHGEAPMLAAADVGAIIHWENAIPALAAAV
jgi:electron transfer flavoprotein alpha/beta subunit